ncbi:hypothetical protein [Streptomyces coeruleorubidus]|uniref:hypothetical protein n=1 Tax=Streptomyces coeruleorubidus TaxID=116188 RepID=UPI0033C0A7D8
MTSGSFLSPTVDGGFGHEPGFAGVIEAVLVDPAGVDKVLAPECDPGQPAAL